MITKVARTRKASAGSSPAAGAQYGRDVGGLMRYLYGAGKKDEHTDQHLVGSWDRDPARHEPPVFVKADGSTRISVAGLAGELTDPVSAAVGMSITDPHVYHLVLSTKGGVDRDLSDDEWATIAADMMDVAGIAPAGDPLGCRWVAVRHGKSVEGNDHVHVVATLARQDGTKPRIWGDYQALRLCGQKWERELGLTMTADGDHTARISPPQGEREKEAREGITTPRRVVLARKVADAASAGTDDESFFANLKSVGLMVNKRMSTTNPGEVTGFSVGLPGHRDRDGKQVFYSGSKLDGQSLPKLRAKWVTTSGAELNTGDRDQVYEAAGKAFKNAAATLDSGTLSPGQAAGVANAAGQATTAWAAAQERRAGYDGPLTASAEQLARAGRPSQPTESSSPAAGLAVAGQMLYLLKSSARSDEERRVLEMLSAMMMLANSVAKWREQQGKYAQAGAASAAGTIAASYAQSLQSRHARLGIGTVPVVAPGSTSSRSPAATGQQYDQRPPQTDPGTTSRKGPKI